jgi:plasmid maintenance system antidote protein VapI
MDIGIFKTTRRKPMDIKKSVRKAMGDRPITWLANELGVSRARAYAILSQKKVHQETLMKLADVFDMSVSELIALGEE